MGVRESDHLLELHETRNDVDSESIRQPVRLPVVRKIAEPQFLSVETA